MYPTTDDSVNPVLSDLMVPSELYLQTDIDYPVSVTVADPQGIEDIRIVEMFIFPENNSILLADAMKDDGTMGDIIPGDGIKAGATYVLNGADPTNPYASPLYGDYTGCCPALIQVGSEEVLLDDSRRLAYKMEASGIPVVLDVWNKMPHVWQVMAMLLPEGRVAIDRIGVFLRGHMRSVSR